MKLSVKIFLSFWIATILMIVMLVTLPETRGRAIASLEASPAEAD